MCATVAKTHQSITLFDVSPRTYKGVVKALGKRPVRVSYDHGVLELGTSILLGIDWQTYSKLIRAFGDKHFRHTYQEGTLEILMSPSEEHERIRSLLGAIVQMTAVECNYWIKSIGSTTQRAEMLLHGLEPDASYYLSRRRSKNYREEKKPSAPDLAIEVDLRHPALGRARSYAKLGVSELWCYRKGVVHFFRLSQDGEYRPANRSSLLPVLAGTHLTRLVKEMFETDESSTMRAYLRWLRKEIKKSSRPSRKKEN